jgi:23S rRNA pseudouridine1911/1915/1917 synthase
MPAERLEVVAALDGERVDRVVAMATGLARSASAQLVADGRVRLGGTVVASRSARVAAGQVLDIDWDVPAGDEPPAPDPTVGVALVHVDEHVIVVDKPAGLVVHPGSGVRGSTLVNGLLARFPELAGVGEAHRPGIVHRLDRGTSGLLVVARTDAAYHRLVAGLAERRVTRRYRCLVLGLPGSAAGVVDAPIGRSRHDPTRRAVVEDGKPSRTRFTVERSFDRPADVSLLSCELETGRTHQIRVHLQAIGHPVVADDVYGGGSVRLGLHRPFLHASELHFDHPVSGRPSSFDSPLAPDLQSVLDALVEASAGGDGGAGPGAGPS